MSGVACHHRPCVAHTIERCRSWQCHHRPWNAHMIGRRWAWNNITALVQLTRSNDVGRGMTSPPLDCTHGRQRRVWHDITIVGQHTQSDDITALGQHARSDDVGRGMTSPPLDSTHGQTTSGVACHHHLLTANTVKRCRAWHAIIAFGQHRRSNNVVRGMISPSLISTHGW